MKFDLLLEMISKRVSPNFTTYENPSSREIRKAYKNSSRGTMLWHNDIKDEPWYLCDEDYTHSSFAFGIGMALEDCHAFYIDPKRKLITLGLNYTVPSEQRGLIDYERIRKNSYWKTLSKNGWTLQDISGIYNNENMPKSIHDEYQKIEAAKNLEKEKLNKNLISDEMLLKFLKDDDIN